jgi:hypothetical protein
MSAAKATMTLKWKDFSVSLPAVSAQIATLAGSAFCGLSADATLRAHFTDDPGQTVMDSIQAYWDGITSESSEATGYTSAASIAATVASAKASGIAKLKALGLSDSEVAALVG